MEPNAKFIFSADEMPVLNTFSLTTGHPWAYFPGRIAGDRERGMRPLAQFSSLIRFVVELVG